MRVLEIADAANKLARHMGIESYKSSDSWLWRYRNWHRIGNKVTRGESCCTDTSVAEPFRPKFNRLMKKENIHIGQLYNADETSLFWRSLPRNTEAFKNDHKIPGKKLNKEKFSALLGVKALGTNRL